jgi:hypothetical protein
MESDEKVGAVAKKASEGAGSLLKAARDEVSAINRGPKKDVEIPRIEEPAPQKEKLEIPPQLTAISDRDQNYLLDVLEQDERLSTIFDRVMDVAVEFSGAGSVKGPGTGVSDSIPARLSDGEFVFTKKAVDQIGAENLQMMMDDAERAFDESNGKLQMQTGGKVSNDMMYNVFQGRPMKSYEVSDELRDAMIRANKMPGTR